MLVAALALAGSAAAGAGGSGAVSVQLALTGESSETLVYSLRCRPPAGTLPFAARVCNAIRRYPDTMFHPDRASVGHSGQPNGPSGPFLELKITANGVTSSFRGTPLGRWGQGFNVYYCAGPERRGVPHEDGAGARMPPEHWQASELPAALWIVGHCL